jgi:hypothetical protein
VDRIVDRYRQWIGKHGTRLFKGDAMFAFVHPGFVFVLFKSQAHAAPDPLRGLHRAAP